jgi:tetratricopeptide (TPR) repeat protein
VTKEARLNGELAFQAAKAHLASGKQADAVVELRKAHALDPGSFEYELYLMWFGNGAGDTPMDAPTRLAIKRAALAANRNDPNLAFALYVLGRLMALDGANDDARRWLERALRIDPLLSEAEAALSELPGDEEPPTSKPILGRMAGLFQREKKG